MQEWLQEEKGESTPGDADPPSVPLSPPDIVPSDRQMSRVNSEAAMSEDVPCIIGREDDISLLDYRPAII